MKKLLFSLLLIGTFFAYALYVRKYEIKNTYVPIVFDTNGSRVRTDRSIANSSSRSQSLPTIQSNSTADAQTSPPTNDQSNLRAQGRVLISNTYPTALTLVRTTRLLTADKKLYRLAQTVTIPANGHTSVTVYADQNGSQYAIGPTKFSVPGLSAYLQTYISVSSDSDFVMTQPASNVASAPTRTFTRQTAHVRTNMPSPALHIKSQGGYRDGTYTGNSFDAYYGYVQIQTIIQNGKIAHVRFLNHPQDQGYSIAVNDYAMPRLTSETIQAQNANVNTISGATETSGAFRKSLSSALAQAKN